MRRGHESIPKSKLGHRRRRHFGDEHGLGTQYHAHPLAGGRLRHQLEHRTGKDVLGAAGGPLPVDRDLSRTDRRKHRSLVSRVTYGQHAIGGPDARSRCHERRPTADEQIGADQLRHVGGARPPEELLPRTSLRNPPSIHHHDPVPEDERLERAMGHVDADAWQLAEKRPQLASELPAGLHVECGQRLVEQQQPRLEYERARQRHPLLLSTGELRGEAVAEIGHAGSLERLLHPRVALAARDAERAEPEGDVLEDREVGKEREVLRHIPDIPLPGRQVHVGGNVGVDIPIEGDRSAIGTVQAGEQPEDGRLPAPLSPTSTVVSPAAAVSSTASSKDPRRSGRSAASIGDGQCEAERDQAYAEENDYRNDEQQDGQGDGGVEVALQGDVDRQRHRLGDAGHVAGKGDGGAELAEGAGPAHRGTSQQRRAARAGASREGR